MLIKAIDRVYARSFVPKPGHWSQFLIVDSYESLDLALQTLSKRDGDFFLKIGFSFFSIM